MELLKRFRQGDPEAFEALFRQFQAEVYGWIVRIVRDPSAAEDLTVETFWRIHRARGRFDPGASFGAWARRIATNLAIDHLRQARREVALPDDLAQPGSADPIECEETRRQIVVAFRRLPLKLRVAGIVVPTAFLLVPMTAFTLLRFVFEVPVPIERVVVFPMALIPNLFGLWNMVYVGLRSRSPLSIGAHGALLPFVIIPLGLTLGVVLGVVSIDQGGVHAFQAVRLTYARGVFVLPVVVVVYYLVWKYIVGFLNDLVGIE